MIVLDTHAWLWWVNSVPGVLPEAALSEIASPQTRIGVASISCLEVALLVKKDRVELPCLLGRWFDLARQGSGIELLALTPAIAEASAALPDLHKDPADRIIIATAMLHRARIATADSTVRRYPDLEFLW